MYNATSLERILINNWMTQQIGECASTHTYFFIAYIQSSNSTFSICSKQNTEHIRVCPSQSSVSSEHCDLIQMVLSLAVVRGQLQTPLVTSCRKNKNCLKRGTEMENDFFTESIK